MPIVQGVLEAVAARWATVLNLPASQVFIDRRSGDAAGDAGYVDMEGLGLTLIPGQGSACASLYQLRLNLTAILTDNGTDPVYAQRLGFVSAANQNLTWRNGFGTPIQGVGFPTIEAASVTEPFDLMDTSYGLAVTWTCQIFLPIAEAW